MDRNSKRNIVTWRTTASGLYIAEEKAYLEHLIWEEKVRMVGVLTILEYPGNNRHEARMLDLGHNLIVDVGRAGIAALQRHTIDGGTAGGTYDLGLLALGNGSNSGASTPTAGTSALFNETTGVLTGVARKNLSVTTPPPGPPFITNLWSAQIGPTEFNVSTGSPALNIINEAALISIDDVTMFSMRTFANQIKSAGITFEFRWTVIF